MKRITKYLSLLIISSIILALFPAGAVFAEKAQKKTAEDELIWTNLNPDVVKNGPSKQEPVIIEDDADPILVHRISTYHWNDGKGSIPGTITVMDGDEELGTWDAVGKDGSGAKNVYWDVDVELIFYPGHTYTITDSDPGTWSWNDRSGKCGMFSLYGLDPAPEEAVGKSTKKDTKYSDIKLFLDGKELTLYDDEGNEAKPVMIDGTVYLPALSLVEALDFDVKWDKEGKAIYIGKLPDEEIPSHCWVLKDVVHEVDKDEHDGAKTWLYDYVDIEDGGRYVIDYTWQHNEEYAHYTAIGECTDVPSYLYPGKYATVNLKTYAEDVVGKPGVWGIPSMGNIQYDFNDDHYATNYDVAWKNVKEDEPTYYNCGDGSFEWKIQAKMPEGEPGESMEFTLNFHRGDRHPVRTTWKYEWHE